jgi:hypothetical protein
MICWRIVLALLILFLATGPPAEGQYGPYRPAAPHAIVRPIRPPVQGPAPPVSPPRPVVPIDRRRPAAFWTSVLLFGGLVAWRRRRQ